MTTLDHNGYPTEEYLIYLRDFDIKEIDEFLDILSTGWWCADWGFKLSKVYKDKRFNRKCRTLELHTGGWSGNEEIISALREGFFFVMYWWKSYRGGHYIFQIPCE
jgi:hypothetical protein